MAGNKNTSTWGKLPYNANQLREHLENLWEDWMNWKNYGVYEERKEKVEY